MAYVSRLDLPQPVRDASIKLLQARLFDAIDLEAQLKLAHWNVRGPAFFQLHMLFDNIHDEVEGFVDTLAERITALGGVADGRITAAAAGSILPEYPMDADKGDEHLTAVASALGEFGKVVRRDIGEAEKAGDADTADLFTSLSRETDKQLWFVEAHLSPSG